MNLSISAAQLFEQLRDKLALRWLAGERSSAQRVLEAVETVARRPSLAGYLNIIYPNKVQILGIPRQTMIGRPPEMVENAIRIGSNGARTTTWAPWNGTPAALTLPVSVAPVPAG